MEASRVAIVIPALNESVTIKNIVDSVAKYGIPIVVDDGSTDDTAEIATQSGAIVVSHKENQGYDAALNSGFVKAAEVGVDVIVTFDADGQHSPELLRKLISSIECGADVVAAIRSHRQRFSEALFSLYARLRFGIQDPLCGMKAYRLEVFLAQGYFDSYCSIGTELLLFAVKNNYRIDQIDFEVQERVGKSRFGSIFTANYKIIRAILLSIWRVKRNLINDQQK